VSRFDWGDDPATWLTEVADAAAAVGFGGLALMDHLLQIPQVGPVWEPMPDPFVALGLLAAGQRGLRLGTLVSPVSYRSAGLLAKAVATLDVLSGGRAFFGIGAGWWAREHAAFGLPFRPLPERLDELAAAIRTMRALWAPGTKPYRSADVQLPETTAYPRPVGPIPVVVGGSGERRTLRIAAELADACNLPSEPAVPDHKLAVLRAHCADVGRDPDEVAVTVLDLPLVGRDRAEVAKRVEVLRGRTTAAAFARHHHAGRYGERHIGRYRTLADRGVSTVFVALPGLRDAADVAVLGDVVQSFRD